METPSPTPAPKKPGRPPKYGEKMTQAERAKFYRDARRRRASEAVESISTASSQALRDRLVCLLTDLDTEPSEGGQLLAALVIKELASRYKLIL